MNTRDSRTATQRHRSTGVTATVTIPSGQAYRAAAGWSVLTADGTGTLRVLRPGADGTTEDTPVTGLPAGARPVHYRPAAAGWATGAAVRPAWDGTTDSGGATGGPYTWKLTAPPPARAGALT